MVRATLCVLAASLTLLTGGHAAAQDWPSGGEMIVVSDESAATAQAQGSGGCAGAPFQSGYIDGCSAGCCGDPCLPLSRCRSERCGCGTCDGCGEGGFFVNLWLDQGFTGNTDDPADNFNGPLLFTDRANEYLMNQLYLQMGRAVNKRRMAWDIGGQIDLLYGSDYYFTTATGLETNRDGSPKWNSANGPRGTGGAIYGLAMPQLYAEVFAPIGNGLTVKMGHFYTIIGYESVMAPENFFYSHSYSMMYGEPFTHTGLLASYDLAPGWEIHGGFTRGWDTWEDPNETLGFLGGVRWTSADERNSIAFALHSGNEDAAGQRNRTMYSLVVSRELTPRLTYVLQHDLGVDHDAAVIGGNRVNGNWYSLNQYFFYTINQCLTLGARVEWFRDENSTRIFTVPASQVEGSDYSQLTLGLNWKPREWVVLRPEVRWDWSGVSAPGLGSDGMFNNFSKKDQFTLGFDLILQR